MHQFTINEILCLLVVWVGVVIDFKTMKIPNLLTFPAAALGLILNAVFFGLVGFVNGVLGWLLGAGITVFFSLLPIGSNKTEEKLGMGDAKLMAVVGAFLGWKIALITFFYFCLSFGVISFFFLARAIPWKALAFLVMSTLNRAETAPVIDTSRYQETKKKPIPAGLAIGIGTILAVVLEQKTIQFFCGG